MGKSDEKQRSVYIDYVKAFAIICVIFGHCIQYGSGDLFLSSGAYFDDVLFKIIYSFHMPLFMLVSGYLFAFTAERKKWYDIVWNKIQTLVVPIFLWSMIPFLVSGVGRAVNSGRLSIFALLKEYISTALGMNLWFLWAVFWCSIIVVAVKSFLSDSIWVYLAGFLLTFIVPDMMNMHLYKFMYPYFIIGYIFNRDGYSVKLKRYYANKTFIITSGMIFAVFLLFYTYDSYIYNTGYYIFKGEAVKQICIDLYRFLIGLAGSIFFLMLIYKLCHRDSIMGRSRILKFIGSDTLGIYIISNLIFSYALNKVTYGLRGVMYIVTAAETVVILSVSLLCTRVIKKNRILNQFLLGGRL